MIDSEAAERTAESLRGQVAALRTLLVDAEDGHTIDCDVNHSTSDNMSGCSCGWSGRVMVALADTAQAAAAHDEAVHDEEHRQMLEGFTAYVQGCSVEGLEELREPLADHDARVAREARAKALEEAAREVETRLRGRVRSGWVKFDRDAEEVASAIRALATSEPAKAES